MPSSNATVNFLKLTDLDLLDKRVLIRADLNVPVSDGKVSSDARIVASLPTIQHCLKAGASSVMVTSHLGRPTEGTYEDQYSLKPVVDRLAQEFGADKVCLVKQYLREKNCELQKRGVVFVLENVRFNKGEKKDDDELSKKYARLCDVFVMDAFGTAHRAQASTNGVGRHAPVACAGLLLAEELEALGRAMSSPRRPMVAVVGGSKVSTKLSVLECLSEIADKLIVGGGIANTFLAASDRPVGKSLCEPDLKDTALRILQKDGCEVFLATDVATATEFAETAEATVKAVTEVSEDDMILDLGPESSKAAAEIINDAATVLWNGPVGVFEFPNFAHGTKTLAEAIASSKAFSVAGGGDTLAAIDKFDISPNDISYISTGGGAFLEFVEGKTLPAVSMLEKAAAAYRSKNPKLEKAQKIGCRLHCAII